MFPYIPNTPEDQKEMLEFLGMKNKEDLFCDVPKDVKLNRDLCLNDPLSEMEVSEKLKAIASENTSLKDLTCFLGAGAYDHYIPSVIKHLVSRSEFYTAYTPYQPEISQGTLQAIFEYQTMICNLTGMEVSNSSMYDGGTACAEAAKMSMEATKRKTVVVSKTVHPEIRKILKTYLKFHGGQVIEVEYKDGETDYDKLKSIVNKDTAAVIIQNPNFFGVIENAKLSAEIAHENKALSIMSVNPISLGILKAPGELGADIVVGEGQSLGNGINFGGPYLGFMATSNKLMRKLPGRIVGETTDVEGKRAYVLTLQAREQHIRRQKATSNICSNEALNALQATIYMSTMGKNGIKEVASLCTQKAHYALDTLVKSGKYKLAFNKPFFMEFVIIPSEAKVSAKSVNDYLLDNKILGGYEVEKDYPELQNAMLMCVTEKRTKEEIDKLASLMEAIL